MTDVAADPTTSREVAVAARPSGVVPVRWPEESVRRQDLAAAGIPRLLLVAAGSVPPPDWAHDEDWVSADAGLEERAHREATILRRLLLIERPPAPAGRVVMVDDDGIARRDGRWVALSELELRLVEPLLAAAGRCVSRTDLLSVGWPGEDRQARVVDGAVRRLRVKLRPLGVAIHGIAGVGYLLEVGANPAP